MLIEEKSIDFSFYMSLNNRFAGLKLELDKIFKDDPTVK